MSLLDDVSIVVTPNGYKAGTLYGVLPTYAEGIDLVDNGDFATDLSGWNITGNDATHTVTWTASGARFQSDTTSPVMEFKQLNLLLSGKQYVLTCNIAYTGVGQLRVNVGTNLTPFTEGANTKYFTATSSTMSFLRENANVDAIIDNVIVKEVTASDMDVTRETAATRVDENGLVNYAEILGSEEVVDGDFPTPNTEWDLFNGATISGGKANIVGDGTVVGYVEQTTDNFTSGKTYKVTFDAVITSGGGLNVKYGLGYSQNIGAILTTGSYIFYYTAAINSPILFARKQGGVAYNSSVTNVSVKEVTRDNVPRIDYTGGGCPHILSEPMRTNLIPYSEDLTEWNKGNLTISSDALVSPDGTQNADTLNVIDDNDFIYEGATTTASTEYVFSFYVKRGTIAESSLKLAVYDDTNNAFIVSNISYSSSDSEWTRVTQSFTTPVGCILIRAYAFRNTSTTLGTFSVWGAQLEEGSYATSYIPNFGTLLGVTRNQDIFTRDGIGSLINDSEGVLFAEIAALSDDSVSRKISLNSGTFANQITVSYGSGGSNIIQCIIYDGTNVVVNMSYSSTNITDFNKIAIKYISGNTSLWVNGVEVDTDNAAFSGLSLSALSFDNGSSTNFFYGKVKQLQVYNTALTDEQLLQLTGESGTDFYESYAEMATALTYTIQ